MKKRDVVIGLLIFAILAGMTYWRNKKTLLPDSINSQLELDLEEAFNLDIPDTAQKAELAGVGDYAGSGIATRAYENGNFSHAVLADLPDPAVGSFYEGWLVSGPKFISTGRMRIAKGGWILEFDSAIDYSDYNGVVITLEKTADKLPEDHVLEGTFK